MRGLVDAETLALIILKTFGPCSIQVRVAESSSCPVQSRSSEISSNWSSVRRIRVPADYEYELGIPGEVHIREIDTVFHAHLRSSDALKPKQAGAFVDGESLGPCVKIRNWRNGDFYNPIGRRASKLKEMFQKERIPQRKRRQWPVFVAESSIVWVASFPRFP